jgi:hypothetical protein
MSNHAWLSSSNLHFETMDQQLQDDAMKSFYNPAGRGFLAVTSANVSLKSMAHMSPASKVTCQTASVQRMRGMTTRGERTLQAIAVDQSCRTTHRNKSARIHNQVPRDRRRPAKCWSLLETYGAHDSSVAGNSSYSIRIDQGKLSRKASRRKQA